MWEPNPISLPMTYISLLNSSHLHFADVIPGNTEIRSAAKRRKYLISNYIYLTGKLYPYQTTKDHRKHGIWCRGGMNKLRKFMSKVTSVIWIFLGWFSFLSSAAREGKFPAFGVYSEAFIEVSQYSQSCSFRHNRQPVGWPSGHCVCRCLPDIGET